MLAERTRRQDEGDRRDRVRRPRRLQEGARDRRQLRDPGDAARLPPEHIKAAVEAGKHIFAEKPVAVDGAGVRSCLASADEITKKGLGLVAGTLYGITPAISKSIKRVHDGADRRHRERLGLVQHHRPVEEGSRAGVERPRVPDAQLALFHLALRRPHRRAARAQHRRAQLGRWAPTRCGPSAPADARCGPRPSTATSTTTSPSTTNTRTASTSR